MKNSTASKSLEQLVEATKSISSDGAMTPVVQPKEEQSCQHFSLRGFVADMRVRNPKVCNPFDGFANAENIWHRQRGPLDVPRFRSVLCGNCVRSLVVRSSTSSEQRLNAEQNSLQICIPFPGKNSSIEHREAGGDSYKAPTEVIILDDSDDDGVIELTTCLDNGKSIIIEVKDDGDSNKARIDVINLEDSDDDEVIELTPLREDMKRDEEKASAGNGVTKNNLLQAKKRPSLDKGKSIIMEVEDDGEEFDTQPQATRKAKDNGQTSGILPSRDLNRGPPYGQAVLDDLNARITITANTLRNQQQQRRNISSTSSTLDLSLSLCIPGTQGSQKVQNEIISVDRNRKRKRTGSFEHWSTT